MLRPLTPWQFAQVVSAIWCAERPSSGETSAARTAALDTAHAASVMPRCASAFQGVATLVVQPDEQIVRVVAGGVAHSVLMMLKKRFRELVPRHE